MYVCDGSAIVPKLLHLLFEILLPTIPHRSQQPHSESLRIGCDDSETRFVTSVFAVDASIAIGRPYVRTTRS